MKESITIALRHQLCCNLLQQPKETNIDLIPQSGVLLSQIPKSVEVSSELDNGNRQEEF